MRDLRGIVSDDVLASPPRIGPKRAERRDQLARVMRMEPGLSDRALSEFCGVSRELVAAVRSELVEAGSIALATERKGADGKVYKKLPVARRQREHGREGTVAIVGEIVRICDENGWEISRRTAGDCWWMYSRECEHVTGFAHLPDNDRVTFNLIKLYEHRLRQRGVETHFRRLPAEWE